MVNWGATPAGKDGSLLVEVRVIHAYACDARMQSHTFGMRWIDRSAMRLDVWLNWPARLFRLFGDVEVVEDLNVILCYLHLLSRGVRTRGPRSHVTTRPSR